MTPHEIRLVQESFRRILPRADQAVGLFYARLFELDPVLRPFASGRMADEGRKLIESLDRALASLDQPETAISALRDIGIRAAGRSATDAHFAAVGAALLWTLGKGLGPDFTPAVREAWTNLYAAVAQAMIQSERDEPLPRTLPPAVSLSECRSSAS